MTNEKDSEQQGQMVTRAFSVTERETGKEIILRPNSSRTVQSIALMRLGLFVPSPKSVGRQSREYKTVGFDATKELQTLSLMESEGFTNISIVGQRLDMSVDFKTWMGIIRTLANHPIDNDKISLKFTEFLKLCNCFRCVFQRDFFTPAQHRDLFFEVFKRHYHFLPHYVD